MSSWWIGLVPVGLVLILAGAYLLAYFLSRGWTAGRLKSQETYVQRRTGKLVRGKETRS